MPASNNVVVTVVDGKEKQELISSRFSRLVLNFPNGLQKIIFLPLTGKVKLNLEK